MARAISGRKRSWNVPLLAARRPARVLNVPSHEMVGDEAANPPGPRCLSAALMLLATLCLSGLAALLWALVHAAIDDAPTLPEVPSFCCPDAIETITALANLTINPCTDFLNYACYKKNELDQKAIAVGVLTSTVLHPTLHGKLRSPVGDLLRMHHRSCLVSAINNLFSPENAVGAIIDIFRRWSGSTEYTIDLVRLVGLLHFRYNIFSVLKWDRDVLRGTNFTGPVISFLYAPQILSPLAASSIQVEDSMFTAAQRHIGRNIPRAAMSSLIARFRAAKIIFEENIFVGKLSLLDKSIPNANMSSWKDALSSFALIGLEDPPNIERVVHVLIDKDILVQEAALIYFSVHAASLLFYEEVSKEHHTLSLTVRASFCDDQIVKIYPLWDMVSTQQMTSPERDAVVLALFDTVAAAVLAEAEAAFSVIVDINQMRNLLEDVRIVLAANLTAPYGRLLPSLSENYFENKFELREFHYQVKSVNDARRLPGLYRFRSNLFQAFVDRAGAQIVISASVYSLLSFNNGSSGGGSVDGGDTSISIVNAAVLGVMIADVLWEVLLVATNWPSHTRHDLFQHMRCLHNFTGGVLTTSLRFPVLSLRATLRVVSTPHWHHRATTFGFHSLSASQVFFMLFLVHHSCHSLATGSGKPGMKVSTFLRHFEEFCEAFGCDQITGAERSACKNGRG
ncbi:hypothetical protein V5799_032705 [Amblyomma americanum]|uniref:Uncharacterized protein n=1 Tax=Amblyomma americanum TaxID=6943 RepID=A0AAQ4DQE8_AMBAM